tara:strand:- start:206 stop:337 length:132 start_codon:yes stop_codon:yes gene_type:complete
MYFELGNGFALVLLVEKMSGSLAISEIVNLCSSLLFLLSVFII